MKCFVKASSTLWQVLNEKSGIVAFHEGGNIPFQELFVGKELVGIEIRRGGVLQIAYLWFHPQVWTLAEARLWLQKNT